MDKIINEFCSLTSNGYSIKKIERFIMASPSAISPIIITLNNGNEEIVKKYTKTNALIMNTYLQSINMI